MLTEDYIMRMINQALAVFLAALGLKRARKYNEALQTFDAAMEGLLGLRANLVKQLDDRQLLDLLTFRDRLDVDRLLLLGDIYREEAELFTMQGQPDESKFASHRALRLYLEGALSGELNLTVELARKVETVRHGLSAADLPVETRLALLDYFERLLASGDDFIASAGVIRTDVLREHAELESGDLN